MAVELQVAILYAVVNGHLNDVPVDQIRLFEAALFENLKVKHADLLERIAATGDLSKDDAQLLAAILDDFVKDFLGKN